MTTPAEYSQPGAGATDTGEQARADWDERVVQQIADSGAAAPRNALAAPASARAQAAVGHVRLSWAPVEGAAGYLVERSSAGHPAAVLEHGGADVPAVPGTAFADTGLEPGTDYTYRIAAVLGADYPGWNWSEPVTARSLPGPAGPLALAVDAATVTGPLHRVWEMVGSERLTQLRLRDDGFGHDVGTEFAAALAIARADLGVRRVRAHAIFHDDNHVVTRAADGALRFDFSAVDALYDQILAIGLRPVVELSFMPAALAADTSATVFTYRGIISPPADWAEWRALVGALAGHLVSRYGLDEVACWPFEVWNEPNLGVFWTGTQEDYLRMYDESARAVKDVSPRLQVGGPATAASKWIEALAGHAAATGVPLDFITSHTYGNLPLDTRPSLRRHGFDDVPTWWTEWGIGSTHFGPIHDGVAGAPFVLSGLHDVQGRMEALAYWVVSDHFEELGRPQQLFHNGFGLLTVGNLRKPRYWGVHLAAHLGDDVLAADLTGDGAGVLVRAWAAAGPGGVIDVLVWNGTVNAALMHGDSQLDRTVEVSISGLADQAYQARLARVDEHHSNICDGYPQDADWPDEEQWDRLRAADRLHEEPVGDVTGPRARFRVTVPLPGVARLRLTPSAPADPARVDVR